MSNNPESGVGAPGSFSIADLLLGAAQTAVRDSASECSRAEGKRGTMFLTVELTLGDAGEPLWIGSAVYFRQKRHHKDNSSAREKLRVEVD